MGRTFSFAASYFATVWIISQILLYILPSCIYDPFVHVCCFFTSIVFSYYCYPWFKRWYLKERVSPHNKAILITGCDSGFGHMLAKRLHSDGFLVFASCLFPEGEGAKNLKKSCSDRLHVFELDVTKTETITDAVSYVKRNLGNSELWAVVNNAGIFQGNEVELSRIETFESCLNVNSLGPVRVTKAFLPLLRSSKGRIVITASILGRFGIRNASAYTMSKFAVVAFSDCIREELRPWGVKVITIEPEGFRTFITSPENIQGTWRDNWQDIDEEVKADYGETYISLLEDKIKFLSTLCTDKLYKVVDALEDAVFLQEPHNVYKPTRNAAFSIFIRLVEASPRSIQEVVFKVWCILTKFPEPREAQNCF